MGVDRSILLYWMMIYMKCSVIPQITFKTVSFHLNKEIMSAQIFAKNTKG